MTEAELQQKKQEWILGEHNNTLLTMGFHYKNSGYDVENAILDMQNLYDGIDTPGERDSHHKEVERAFRKAYESDSTPVAPKQQRQVVRLDRKKLSEFHAKLNGTDWKARIRKWDGEGHGETTTRDVLWSLYRNCPAGYVAYYGNKSDTLWLDVANQFKSYDDGGIYCTLCTFEEKSKRTKENMESLAFFVIEIDLPHDQQEAKQDMTDEEKKVLREKNLEDTCRLVEALGVEPTTITFSGSKSWHVAFRLAKPVGKAKVEENRILVSDALETLGADPAMCSVVRSSRIPKIFPKCLPDTDKETRQHVVYWNPEAEVEYDELIEKLVKLAEEAGGVKLQQLPDIKKTCPFQYKKEDDGNGNVIYKLDWVDTKWEEMIRELGVFRMTRDGNPVYIRRRKNGLYREMELEEIGDYILNEIGRYSMKIKAKMREKRDTRMPKWYVGINDSLNLAKDTRDCVIIPFRDRIARITKDDICISNGYGGFDIPENSPTLWLRFEPDHAQSEFEAFLRHACGELESNPEWQKRFEAFKCLAGYLISGKKEHTNWMCILTDEAKDENEGGTGKSIFMTGISHVRETEFRDERRATRDGARFEDTDWSPTSRILWRDEIPRNYDWAKDFATASKGKSIEMKGKNRHINIGFDDMQKLVYCTNFFPSGLGSAYERRKMTYELSNHYKSKVLTPETEFGHMMYVDWNEAEWQRFYTFMCECVQTYLKHGKLIDSGSRYEAEKTENVNIPSDFIQWFEDDIENSVELMTGQQLLMPQSDVLVKYSNWYYARYGRRADVLPRNKKNKWMRVLSENRDIQMEEKSIYDNGRYVWHWVFEKRTPAIQGVENAGESKNQGSEIDNGAENGDTSVLKGDTSDSKKPIAGVNAGVNSTPIPTQNTPGNTITSDTSDFSSKLEEKEEEYDHKNTPKKNDKSLVSGNAFIDDAPDANVESKREPWLVMDFQTQTFEIHFDGKRPKPACTGNCNGERSYAYEVEEQSIPCDADGNPKGQWKIVEHDELEKI